MADAWHPKKYWWVVAVVVPLGVAVVAVVPALFEKSKDSGSEKSVSVNQTGSGNVSQVGGINISGSDLSQKMYFTTVSVIAGEYQKAKGQPLTDELKKEIERAINLAESRQHTESAAAFQGLVGQLKLPALYNNLAVVQARAGQSDAARKALNEALALAPSDSAVNLNMGLLDASSGKLSEALPALQKAAALPEGKALATAVQSELNRDKHTVELEPNNDVLHPTSVVLDTAIQGALVDDQDVDFFSFKTLPGNRDVVQVTMENRSTTLSPALTVFNANKSNVGGDNDGTAGANVDFIFSAFPDTAYYVSVSHYVRSAGAYQLTIKPLKKYDRFEPNDDLLQAKPIQIGSPVEAEIMDGDDKDFFKVTTSAKAKMVKVTLENRSTTLSPAINVFNPDKSNLGGENDGTAGANVSYSFKAAANTTYYIAAGYYVRSQGAYSLTVKEE